MRTPKLFRAWSYVPEPESAPKIWTLAGLGQMDYAKLPWSDKFELMKKHKPTWVVAWWKAPFVLAWQRFKLWKNEPKGGYLFAAWCRHNAETSEFKGPPMSWYDPPEVKIPHRRSRDEWVD